MLLLRSSCRVSGVPDPYRARGHIPRARENDRPEPGHHRTEVCKPFERAKWVRIGSVIGGETRGTMGKRSDANLQVRTHIALIAAGSEAASIGLEGQVLSLL
jgi:hypothetical protein